MRSKVNDVVDGSGWRGEEQLVRLSDRLERDGEVQRDTHDPQSDSDDRDARKRVRRTEEAGSRKNMNQKSKT